MALKECVMEAQRRDNEYLQKIFAVMQMLESMRIVEKNAPFSQTELRLLGEVINAKNVGKRYISTRLADVLGITRSAVSQIVNNLEKRGVVKRMPDDVDKKIAYVEITDDYAGIFEKELKNAEGLLGNVVKKMGEQRFLEMCNAFESMGHILEEEFKKLK